MKKRILSAILALAVCVPVYGSEPLVANMFLLNRGAAVNLLYEYEGSPATEAECPFTDVEAESTYKEAIAWAAEIGIIFGYDADTFGPQDHVTREQLAVIFHRYAMYKGLDVSDGENTNILSYEDAFEISQYAFPGMQWACAADLLTDIGNGNLAPKGVVAGNNAAQMLQVFEQ